MSEHFQQCFVLLRHFHLAVPHRWYIQIVYPTEGTCQEWYIRLVYTMTGDGGWQKTGRKLEWSSWTVAGVGAGTNGSHAEKRNRPYAQSANRPDGTNLKSLRNHRVESYRQHSATHSAHPALRERGPLLDGDESGRLLLGHLPTQGVTCNSKYGAESLQRFGFCLFRRSNYFLHRHTLKKEKARIKTPNSLRQLTKHPIRPLIRAGFFRVLDSYHHEWSSMCRSDHYHHATYM
jgi:hypothetical protein